MAFESDNKPKKNTRQIILLIILLIAAGCIAGYYYHDYIPASIKTYFVEESDLLTINKISLDSSYDDVKKLYPGMGPLQGQGDLSATESVFTESAVKAIILKHPVEIKFNYQNGKLTSYCFTFEKLDKNHATDLFNQITETFTPVLNEPHEQLLELDNEHVNRNYWHAPTFSADVTMSTTDSKTYVVTAGYQKEQGKNKR